ncbi:MAG: glycosyltransferase family 2 protein [Clostridia bacterium]|nr:glycosyltransferase family 2 protein [Clostridia bacterium]
MLISVIIPVYNVKEYLEKCVNSVMDTDFTDYEIILVDDGSTDGVCPELCDKIASAHPKTVRVIHQQNKGLGGARNTGIDAAKGEYLLFVDSDDTVVKNTLSILANKIKETGSDIIAFNIYTENALGERNALNSNYACYSKPFTLKEHPEFLLSLPNAWSRIWKKTLYTENNIQYPERAWYEDIRTTLKVFAKAESIFTINDNLYVYLQREGSIMRSANIERNVEIIDAFEDIISWFKQQGLFEEYKDELCRLAIDNIIIAASVRVLMANTKHPLLTKFKDYTKENFPDFKKNKYINKIPGMKKLAYKLVMGNRYKILKLLFTIKK